MKILKPELLYEIDNAKTKLDASKVPQLIGEMFKDLEDQTITNISLQDQDNARRKQQVITNFRNAWNYGVSEPRRNLDMIYLTEVAGRVEPDLRSPGQEYAEVRKEIRQFLGGYVPPADETRIRAHLERLMQAEKSMNLHPVERAIFDYFHLIRIQPFFNGNKRTAGIVMNTMLRTEGYLPISIPDSQVSDYESYLLGAIEGFKEKGSENNASELTPYQKPDFKQLQFYDFLGRKELCALRCAENKLAGMSSYSIDLSHGDPSVGYRLKHELRDYFKARGLHYKTHLEDHGRSIQIIGEIPMRTLESIVNKTSGIKKAKIKID